MGNPVWIGGVFVTCHNSQTHHVNKQIGYA